MAKLTRIIMDSERDLDFSWTSNFIPTDDLMKGWLYLRISTNNRNSKKLKRYVIFQRGHLVNESEASNRLIIYKSKPLFRNKQYKEIFVNESCISGLVNGTEVGNIGYRLSGMFPTITLVKTDVSIVLIFAKRTLEKRMLLHSEWNSKLKEELHFGGYWSIQDVQRTLSRSNNNGIEALAEILQSCVIVCCMTSKLAILNQKSQKNEYSVEAEYNLKKLENVKRQDCSKEGNTTLLSLTFCCSSECEYEKSHLRFKIKEDSNISQDLCSILENIQEMNAPSVLDDPVVPPPRCPQRQIQPPRNIQNENTYDLNYLSSGNGVRDAIHHYENSPLVTSPDVLVQMPPSSAIEAEDDYWGICTTLCEILKRQKPLPDTLGLSERIRLKLCFYLLDVQLKSWKDLAEYVGLTQDAVRMIETLFQSGMLFNLGQRHDIVTPTECILRHWQYIHNQKRGNSATNYPCTKEGLIKLMEQMQRNDLVELIRNDRMLSSSFGSNTTPRPSPENANSNDRSLINALGNPNDSKAMQ